MLTIGSFRYKSVGTDILLQTTKKSIFIKKSEFILNAISLIHAFTATCF